MKKFIGYDFQTPIYSVLASLRATHPFFYWQRDLIKWFIQTYLRIRKTDVYMYHQGFVVNDDEKEVYKAVMEHSNCTVVAPENPLGPWASSLPQPIEDKALVFRVKNIICAMLLEGVNVHVCHEQINYYYSDGTKEVGRNLLNLVSIRVNHQTNPFSNIETIMTCESGNSMLHYGTSLTNWLSVEFQFIIAFSDAHMEEIKAYKLLYPKVCVLRINKNQC